MKRFGLIFIIITLTLFSVASCAEAGGQFSEGIRFGIITKASAKGMFNKSCEGEMFIGNESTPYSYYVGSGDSRRKKTLNPWMFSGKVDFVSPAQEIMGEKCYITYEQAHFNTGANFDTDYRIKEIKPLKALPSQKEFKLQMKSGFKSDGVRIGYICKASQKGMLVNSWEIILQEGLAGGKFIEMTITDKAMYDYAKECVMSGARVKVKYIDEGILGNMNMSNDTRYRITSIKIIGQ